MALIGLRFHPAASQLSASHFRQLRHFEIEETIKEHCVFLLEAEAEAKDIEEEEEEEEEKRRRRSERKEEDGAHKKKRESMCSFPMEIRFTNNKQKAEAQKSTRKRKTGVVY